MSGLIIYLYLSIVALSQTTLTWQKKLEIKLPIGARSLAYKPDSASIAVGHTNGQVSLWNCSTGKLLKLLGAQGKQIETIFFKPNGDWLIAISEDNNARIWAVSDWKELALLQGITPVSGLSSDGNWLVTQNPRHEIDLWDMQTMKRAKQLGETGLDGALNINFTGNDKKIAVAYKHKLNLIDVDTGKITELSIRSRPQGLKAQQTGTDTISLSLGMLDDDSAIIHRVIPSMIGSLLAVGRGWYGMPNFVDVWDYSTGKMIRRFKPKDDGGLAQFSIDNSLLAIGGAGSVSLWSLADGHLVASFKASLVYEDTALAKGGSLFMFSPVPMELSVIDGRSLLIYRPL